MVTLVEAGQSRHSVASKKTDSTRPKLAVLPSHYDGTVAAVHASVDLSEPCTFPRHAGTFRVNRRECTIAVDPLYGHLFGVRPIEARHKGVWSRATAAHASHRHFRVSSSHPAVVEPAEGEEFSFLASERFPAFAEGFPGVEHIVAILSGPAEDPRPGHMSLAAGECLLIDPTSRNGYIYQVESTLAARQKMTRQLQNPQTGQWLDASEDLQQVTTPDGRRWRKTRQCFRGPALCDIRRPVVADDSEVRHLSGRYVDKVSVPRSVKKYAQKTPLTGHFEFDERPFLMVSTTSGNLYVGQILVDLSGTDAFDATMDELDRARAFHHRLRLPQKLPTKGARRPAQAVRRRSTAWSSTTAATTSAHSQDDSNSDVFSLSSSPREAAPIEFKSPSVSARPARTYLPTRKPVSFPIDLPYGAVI